MKKILVADDDKEIVELLSIYLRNEGYQPVQVFDGQQALDTFRESEGIEMLILDIMMPRLSGMQVVLELRKFSQVPVLFLTAKAEDMDKIRGLVAGADDYVTKPFNPLEIMARIKTILKRANSIQNVAAMTKNTLVIGPLIINRDSHMVKTMKGKEVQLTSLEFGILYLLASHPNRVFSADEIFEKVWKPENVVSAKTVMVHVSHLREKIYELTGIKKYIQTVWGVGYKIEEKKEEPLR